MDRDLYKILGVERSATDSELKRAYRKLAQKYHPDVNQNNPDAEQKFKEVNLAYEILSDKQKKAQYDQFGFTGGNPGAGGFSGFDPSGFSGGFADIFETFFGGGHPGGTRRSPRRGPVPGGDIESVITLTLEESAFGAEKSLEITRADHCPHCKGEGAEPNTSIVDCSECQGTGQVRATRQTILGNIQTVRTCSKCQGQGRLPETPCRQCHGKMRTRQKTTVTIKIPAGIDNGATIRLNGKGEAGIRGGQHGNLYLHVQVSPHAQFKRQGYDIYSNHTLHVLQPIVGDTIAVDTLHGQVNLKIPAGTQHGQTFKIKEHGVPKVKGNGKGDHYVTVTFQIPKKLKKREKELYAELIAESGLEIQNDEGWWSKFKLS